MAKKKKETDGSTETTQKPADKKDLMDFIVSGQSLINRPRKIIPISPATDVGIGGGIPEGTFFIPTGPPKLGKMQPVLCGVYTPFGFKKIKDLMVGDLVCTPDGWTVKINLIVPHGMKDVYKISFNDGTYTFCGLEHLWKVKSRFRKEWNIVDVEHLLKSNLYENDGRPRWAIPLTKPVYFEDKELEIKPYTLGVLLGDGNITTKTPRLSSVDTEIVDRVNSELDYGFYFSKLNGDNCDWFLKTTKKPNKYRDILKKLKLYGKNSHTKFIPKKYLYNSVEKRVSLLQGLLDTDGYISKDGVVEFYTTSIRLAKDVRFLVQSLGGFTTIKPKKTKCNDKYFDSYRLHIRMTDKSMLFSLPRKVDRVCVRTKNPLQRYITNIKLMKKQAESACIKLDNTDGLYLTNDFIVTHNTVTALQLASNAQKPEHASKFDSTGRDVYFYNIEGRLKARDLMGIRGLNINKFHIIESQPGKILSGEDYIDLGEKLINEKPGTVHIFDSFSQLCTQARRDGDIRDRVRDDAPLLLANFCKRICNVLPVNDTIVVGITHIIANQGGGPMSKPTSEASGNKIQYGSDTKLIGKWKEKWEVGGNQIGQMIHWRCEWSALGPPSEFTSYLRYGYGLDRETELVDIAAGLGVIVKGGAWFTFPDGNKEQGLEKARLYLVEKPELYEEIWTQIKTMLNINTTGV